MSFATAETSAARTRLGSVSSRAKDAELAKRLSGGTAVVLEYLPLNSPAASGLQAMTAIWWSRHSGRISNSIERAARL
jgi:hypothetical protein